MLSKKNRLSRLEFSQFFKTGKRFQSPVATLIYTTQPNQFNASVVVSKKVNKKAVSRNKLRRRVYAQLYNALRNQKTGVFIVVLKPTFNSLSKKQQHQEITGLIELVR